MGIEELYKELNGAYSDENLNLITGKLILLYKNRNFDKIREIAGRVLKSRETLEEKDAKLFSRLIMMYHPDKGEQLRNRIRQLYHSRDIENLNKYAHVLLISDIEEISVHFPDQDIDYNIEYSWDYGNGDEFFFDDPDLFFDSEDMFINGFESYFTERNFYHALRIRGYGTQGKSHPWIYVNYLEELDFSRNGLESLDGVEHCAHTRYLDVSSNELSDISKIAYLEYIEELYLENNMIASAEPLGNLVNLRILDLSGNYINDISPLMNLRNLEFVNITGNPVPAYQVENLRLKGVLVMVS